MLFLNNGQYNQAAAAFKKVIKADPSAIEAHHGLGQAYLEIGAYDDAKIATEETLRRNPNHRQARELLQIIQFAKNQEKHQGIRKKVLRYAAIFAVIALGVFIAIRFDLLPSWWNNAPPNLSINVSLEEPSKNKALDAGETGRLRLKISNSGGTARNIRIKFDPTFITGIDYKPPDIISKLKKNSTENIAVEMSASDHARPRTQSLKILLILVENDKTILASKNFSLKIRGARR